MNPTTGKVGASVPAADAVDVDRAVSTARQALRNPEWRDLSPMVRAELLHRLADRVKRDAVRLADLETKAKRQDHPGDKRRREGRET